MCSLGEGHDVRAYFMGGGLTVLKPFVSEILLEKPLPLCPDLRGFTLVAVQSVTLFVCASSYYQLRFEHV